MPVSLSGLDMSWLKNPDNRLPVEHRVRRKPQPKGPRSDLATPTVMSDIKPFISNATAEPTLITSRSGLRAYEAANGIKQCGDYKPGQVISEQNTRIKEATHVSEADKAAADFKWVD